LWALLAYVERNALRAKLVKFPKSMALSFDNETYTAKKFGLEITERKRGRLKKGS